MCRSEYGMATDDPNDGISRADAFFRRGSGSQDSWILERVFHTVASRFDAFSACCTSSVDRCVCRKTPRRHI